MTITRVRIHPGPYESWPLPPSILRFFRGPRAACRVGRGEIGTRVEKTRLRVFSYRGPHFDEKPAEVWRVLNTRSAQKRDAFLVDESAKNARPLQGGRVERISPHPD